MLFLKKFDVNYEILINISSMKIYFAGSIRGGRGDAKLYETIIIYLGTIGQVLTEHVGDKHLSSMGEAGRLDTTIYNRDIEWLRKADMIIAEVTTPSLGVGYELAFAEKLNKPILCLYQKNNKNSLSAMISGNKKLICKTYKNFSDAKIHIQNFIQNTKSK